MTAEQLTPTVLGGPIGSGSAKAGSGMAMAIYTVDCTENDDWVILSKFDAIKYILGVVVSSNVYTAEPLTVDTSTTNKVVMHAGGSDTIRMMVWGTPANTD